MSVSAAVPAVVTWLEHRPFAIAIAESTWFFPIIETIHVLALTVVVGSVAMMDLRLLGVGNKDRPASEVIASSLPWAWSAFAVAFAAGSLMFSSKAASYYVNVPRHFDLDLAAHNGGLTVEGVSGRLVLDTHNGGVALVGVGGDVRANTQNGSLNVQLTGTKWDGTGLDAETRNGSVRLAVPEQYAAQLETGTVNGSIRTDIPVTLSGRISRQLSIPLGGGGRTIRAMTTNGSVQIMRR